MHFPSSDLRAIFGYEVDGPESLWRGVREGLPPVAGDRRAEGHPLLLLAGEERAQRPRDYGHGLLVDQPIHWLRFRLRVLLRAVHPSLRHGTGGERRENDRRSGRSLQQASALARVRAEHLRQEKRARSIEQDSEVRQRQAPEAARGRDDRDRNRNRS